METLIVFESMEYETKDSLDQEELLAFYQRQHHKTTHSRRTLQRMLDQTFCFVTARCHGELVGLARGITCGSWGRIAECKLDPAYQGPGCVTKTDGRIEHDAGGIAAEMARRLIEAMRTQGCERIDVLAHETEVDFCEELGFRRIRGAVPMVLSADAVLAGPAAVATAERGSVPRFISSTTI